MYRAKRAHAAGSRSPPSTPTARPRRPTASSSASRSGRSRRVAYQPIVSVATGELVAFEALARRPARRARPGRARAARARHRRRRARRAARPPRAEAACRALADLVRDGLALHVNLSPSSVANPGLAAEMQRRGRARGTRALAAPRSSSRAARSARTPGPAAPIAALRALGAQVVADDLGAGGPTLAVLARTPFDLLKLDRSLVASVDSDERARAVAAAIVALGQHARAQRDRARESSAPSSSRRCARSAATSRRATCSGWPGRSA